MNNILKEDCTLRLNYRELRQLFNLLRAYKECDPDSLPGITGDGIKKLDSIFEKFSNKFDEAKELQLKFNGVLEEHFKENWSKASGGYGTDYIQINDYFPNTELALLLTVGETLVLYYYVDLFKSKNSVVGNFWYGALDTISSKLHVIEDIDILLKRISDSILRYLPQLATFEY